MSMFYLSLINMKLIYVFSFTVGLTGFEGACR